MPDGTQLRVHRGNLVLDTPGATYDSMDIHGLVTITAPNVTIRRSIIRGGVVNGSTGLVTNIDPTATNFVIEDSTLVPSTPSVFLDGLKGGNYTARRLDISGVVDGAKVHGNNVSISGTWIHGMRWFSSDPYQGGTGTHNDGIQVLGGANVSIVGNDISGASGAAIQVTQDYSDVRNMLIQGNFLGGGGCSLNVAEKGGPALQQFRLLNNRFERTSTFNCPAIIARGTTFENRDNTWRDNGVAIPIQRN